MAKIGLSIVFLCCCLGTAAQRGPELSPAAERQVLKTGHVFLITLDGLRWQELFMGADASLIANDEFVDDTLALKKKFWRASPEARRETLMPFFWDVIGQKGQLYGNRPEGSLVNVTNPFWFSYPGYNEILTGHADKRINSNDKRPNPNRTVLDFIASQADFKGKVAAFGSWDVFPSILNSERADYPVNAGYDTVDTGPLTDREYQLNRLLHEIPPLWSSVRFDAFTHHYALEHLKKTHPRVLYIAYGETDDFAHGGAYDSYLLSAHKTDRFIKELWDFAQSDPQYKGKTTFIITTDHGRGTTPVGAWRGHGASVEGADEIWIAVIGPDTPTATPEGVKGTFYQNQIAATVAAFLGFDFNAPQETGPVLKQAFRRAE